MKNRLKKEKGITLTVLVITIIVVLILTGTSIYNAQGSIRIQKLTKLVNDIELLREKVSEYYNEYGEIPAKIEYTNINSLSNILSQKNDIGKFYVIDLEAMNGISLNYGKDYENIKNNPNNADKYTDVYIINKNSHNIFFVHGITIERDGTTTTYYTDYTKPDETTVDLRYINGILIPNGYYYIGTTKDSGGNEYIVISSNKEEDVDETNTNQYTWTKQVSNLESIPNSINLESNQNEYEFLESVNYNKGYFKNSQGKVIYNKIDEEKWSKAYTKESNYIDKNGDKVTIPQGFKISMAETMNTISKGLVVKDSNDNQWVWIKVPQKVFTTATKSDEYEKIETDLKEYVKKYRLDESTSEISNDWKDEWYDGCGLTQEEYTKTYQTMLSSLYENNGFWVSRYEIGDETSTNNNYTVRTNTSGTIGTPVSKKNIIPYNFITCSQAQELATKISTDVSKTKSLLFGIQWDLICTFIEKNSELDYTDIAEDSSSWANIYFANFVIYKGRYFNSNNVGWIDASVNNYTKAEKTSTIITTGSNEKSKVLNIYDFSGNMIEWTLEKYKSENAPTGRGGSYSSLKDHGKASDRINSSIFDGLENSRIDIGFRITMY